MSCHRDQFWKSYAIICYSNKEYLPGDSTSLTLCSSLMFCRFKLLSGGIFTTLQLYKLLNLPYSSSSEYKKKFNLKPEIFNKNSIHEDNTKNGLSVWWKSDPERVVFRVFKFSFFVFSNMQTKIIVQLTLFLLNYINLPVKSWSE